MRFTHPYSSVHNRVRGISNKYQCDKRIAHFENDERDEISKDSVKVYLTRTREEKHKLYSSKRGINWSSSSSKQAKLLKRLSGNMSQKAGDTSQSQSQNRNAHTWTRGVDGQHSVGQRLKQPQQTVLNATSDGGLRDTHRHTPTDSAIDETRASRPEARKRFQKKCQVEKKNGLVFAQRSIKNEGVLQALLFIARSRSSPQPTHTHIHRIPSHV